MTKKYVLKLTWRNIYIACRRYVTHVTGFNLQTAFKIIIDVTYQVLKFNNLNSNIMQQS